MICEFLPKSGLTHELRSGVIGSNRHCEVIVATVPVRNLREIMRDQNVLRARVNQRNT